MTVLATEAFGTRYGSDGYGTIPYGGDTTNSGFGAQGFGSGDFGQPNNPYGTSVLFTQDYWILAEDHALREALKGVNVSDGNSPARSVGVWFGEPDEEIQKKTYPFFQIDLIDIIENRPQVMTTYGPLDDGSADYMKGLPQYDDDYGVSGFYGLSPMLLVYQVTAWSRQPRHDRTILNSLLSGVFHPRFGQLRVPADGTTRRVVVTNFVKRDTLDNQKKRLFRNIWTIQIPSEIFYDPVDLTARVGGVILNSNVSPDLANQILYPGLD